MSSVSHRDSRKSSAKINRCVVSSPLLFQWSSHFTTPFQHRVHSHLFRFYRLCFNISNAFALNIIVSFALFDFLCLPFTLVECSISQAANQNETKEKLSRWNDNIKSRKGKKRRNRKMRHNKAIIVMRNGRKQSRNELNETMAIDSGSLSMEISVPGGDEEGKSIDFSFISNERKRLSSNVDEREKLFWLFFHLSSYFLLCDFEHFPFCLLICLMSVDVFLFYVYFD